MWRQLEKQAGVATATAAAMPETDKPDVPEAGRITAPRRRGWKIRAPRYSAPRYMERSEAREDHVEGTPDLMITGRQISDR